MYHCFFSTFPSSDYEYSPLILLCRQSYFSQYIFFLFLTQIVTCKQGAFDFQVFAFLIIKKIWYMWLIILKTQGLLVVKFLSPHSHLSENCQIHSTI